MQTLLSGVRVRVRVRGRRGQYCVVDWSVRVSERGSDLGVEGMEIPHRHQMVGREVGRWRVGGSIYGRNKLV